MMRSFKSVRSFSVASCYTCGIGTLLLILLLPFTNIASTNKHPRQNNWFIAGSTGFAIRSQDITENFNFSDGGFRHRPGFAYDLGFGRTMGPRWEAAIRLEAFTLFGHSDLPHYTSVGYYTAYPGLLDQDPLEYISQNNSVSLIFRIFLNSGNQNRNSAVNFRPFIEAGSGINNFTTEVRYSTIPAGENSSLIYRDRNGNNANGKIKFISGIGLKIGEAGEWNGVMLLNAEWVEFSRLNALHHLTNRNKANAGAIVARFTAGLAIPVRRSVKSDNYLPFRW